MAWLKQEFKRLYEQHTALTIGTVSSIVVLVLFFILQYLDARVLGLDTRWLLVSLLPLLVALLVGNYIQSFKGFGVELEGRLEKPVTSITLYATDAVEESVGAEKRSRNYLQVLEDLKNDPTKSINRLIFRQGHRDYYTAEIITKYITELPRIEYFEVREEDGGFVALLPTKIFKENNEPNTKRVSDFIQALENRSIITQFHRNVIQHSVRDNTGLVEALRVMRKKNSRRIVVVTDENKFVGLLFAHVVEKRIADEVLIAKA